MKKRTFEYTKIEICRNCHGAGFVAGGYNSQVAPVCTVCAGSGRITKSVKGSVSVEPCTQPATTADPYKICYP